ncbi:Clp protease N-terminal domain-containing protein [Nocardia macrotermitis]|uniref:ATP-dependent Clp protease ATP-binding subunit ClpC1 n=1 Tax=Nocardia macrotermitis TaxID=2585198 RepID=A0A7K0CXR1_9NOCA|nr:Clp protease N-terminal domain-containing protein [Nocardia macrotermitis]MQY18266.1 ATP-dependent Clp protease ATP-binding subunit ClpC1 [Nocardia macrotermitis]
MFERFAKAARYAVVMAQEEARTLRAPHIDVEHLLLGLAAGRDDGIRKVLADRGITAATIRESLSRKRSAEPLGEQDAAALRSIGIDLDAVRESLEATFGADALDRAAAPEKPRGRFGFGGGSGTSGMNTGHIPFTKSAKKVLELSLREAIARGDNRIEAAHILLGILRAPTPRTVTLLGGEQGVEALRSAVHELLDRAA